jgi:hypothetical protein
MSYIKRINCELRRDLNKYSYVYKNQTITINFNKCKLKFFLPDYYPFKPFECKIIFNYSDSFIHIDCIKKINLPKDIIEYEIIPLIDTLEYDIKYFVYSKYLKTKDDELKKIFNEINTFLHFNWSPAKKIISFIEIVTPFIKIYIDKI